MIKRLSKAVLSFLFRFGLSACLLIYIFSKIDRQQTLAAVRSAQLSYIIFAGIIFTLILFILLWRWYILIRALELSVRGWDATRFFFIGLFGNLFLPSSIGGDLIKVIGLCKNSSQKPRVVASVLLDRLSGFAGMALVAIVAYGIGYKYITDKALVYPILVMTVLSAGVLAVLFNEKVYSFGCKLFNPFPRLKENLMTMHYDITLLGGRMGEGAKAIGLSCLGQMMLAVIYFLIAMALKQQISFIYFLIFVPMLGVVSIFPSIGGLGVREAGAVYLFGLIGIDQGVAVSISLINFSFMLLAGLIGGVFYVTTVPSGRLQYSPSDTGPG